MCQMQHLSCIDTQKFAVYNNFGFDGRATRVNFHNDSVLMVTFTLLLQQHFCQIHTSSMFSTTIPNVGLLTTASYIEYCSGRL